MISTVTILDVPFADITERELIEHLDEGMTYGMKRQICFVPTNSILAARKDQAVKKTYKDADLVICDGVPVLWASHFLGKPLKQRLTGFDFFPHFIAHCAARGYSIFLMGASEGVAAALSNKYRSLYPTIKIAGNYAPPFMPVFSDDENSRMVNMINESGADVLFVSLTAPKQDLWIHEHLPNLKVKLALGVGAAFDAENGSIKRAPILMQRLALEWFFRFLQEPRRLFKRYFLEAPVFVLLVLQLKIKQTFHL
jgi:N-acetylglucosaminyldiphosphoundecaprenol N-acetyl-beta-D-mannosaminyltransferase